MIKKARLKKAPKKLRAVDFFCGAGGMTNGFRKAGVDVVAGVDFDETCRDTYEKNNVGSKFINANIKTLTFSELQEKTRIKRDDPNMIFIGCSPCQYWSKIKTDKAKSAESRNLLADFQKFVDYFNPGFVVIENVPGILTKGKVSPLHSFLKFLTSKKYTFSHSIIAAYKHGVPQTRRRFLLIASRVSDISLPAESSGAIPTVRKFIGVEKGFPKIPAGTFDKSAFIHTVCNLSLQNLRRLKLTPKNGGTRMSYVNNKKMAIPTHHKSKLFPDTYGRMYWDKPAPTITTKFFSISNGRFAHPEQNRAISLREGATLQTFAKSYRFYAGSIDAIARQIGNAVPPLLSMKIAKQIVKAVA
jgi:DNA (cytosine-5)-methyltransferase 1